MRVKVKKLILPTAPLLEEIRLDLGEGKHI